MVESPINRAVPTADSTANEEFKDVIGNKLDTHDGDSIKADTYTLLDHIHASSQVYPTLAAGVTVTSNASPWTLGNFVSIVPLNTITEDFDIHHISIEDISANGVFELVLYYDADGVGGSEVEIGRVRFTQTSVTSSTLNIPFQTPIIPANYQIKAKIADNGGGKTADISIFYHTY